MSHSHSFDVGTNVERLIWAQVDRAIELPEMIQRTSRILTVYFGRDALGWQLDRSQSRRQFRPGLALDLRYQAPEVTLTARQFPQRPAHIEREGPSHTAFGRFRGGLFARFFHLFSVAGTVVDAIDGKVEFALTPAMLDAAGRFFLEPRIEFQTGEQVMPRLLAMELVASIV
jgi:hypothetical protein